MIDPIFLLEAALNVAIDDGLVITPLPTAGRAWTEIDFAEDLELARSLLPRLRPGPTAAS